MERDETKTHDLIWDMLRSPGGTEPYRNLRDYFLKRGMVNESQAFDELVRKRCGKDAGDPPGG